MNKKILTAILISIALPGSMLSAPADSLRLKSYKLDEVVVTGTRDETDWTDFIIRITRQFSE